MESNKEFDQIFRTHYTDAVKFALRFMPNLDDAREVAQLVFVHLYERRNEIKIDSNVAGYIKSSVRNRALNELKKDKTRNYYQEDASLFADTIADDAEESSDILIEQLDQAIETLPEPCREIFRLKRIDGLKNQEIADRLNLSKHRSVLLYGRFDSL